MLKEINWKASKSTYAQAWEREMKGMRVINEDAYLNMMKNPLRFGVAHILGQPISVMLFLIIC